MVGDGDGGRSDMELLKELIDLSPGQFSTAADSIDRALRVAQKRLGVPHGKSVILKIA